MSCTCACYLKLSHAVCLRFFAKLHRPILCACSLCGQLGAHFTPCSPSTLNFLLNVFFFSSTREKKVGCVMQVPHCKERKGKKRKGKERKAPHCKQLVGTGPCVSASAGPPKRDLAVKALHLHSTFTGTYIRRERSQSDLQEVKAAEAQAMLVLANRFNPDVDTEDTDVLFRVWAIKAYTKCVPLTVQVCAGCVCVKMISPGCVCECCWSVCHT